MKIAFTPAVHEHAARFVGCRPSQVSRDGEPLFHHKIDRVLAFAGGHSNCLLGTGALPLETPPENIRLIKSYLAG